MVIADLFNLLDSNPFWRTSQRHVAIWQAVAVEH
jgi:hypothetical protein